MSLSSLSSKKNNLKIMILGVSLVGVSVLFAGCTQKEKTTTPSVNPAQTETGSVKKVGDTRKTGLITTAGGKYYLKVSSTNTTEEIDSYGVDLSAYVNQTVTVVGQYSGDTLFVGSIE